MASWKGVSYFVLFLIPTGLLDTIEPFKLVKTVWNRTCTMFGEFLGKIHKELGFGGENIKVVEGQVSFQAGILIAFLGISQNNYNFLLNSVKSVFQLKVISVNLHRLV